MLTQVMHVHCSLLVAAVMDIYSQVVHSLMARVTKSGMKWRKEYLHYESLVLVEGKKRVWWSLKSAGDSLVTAAHSGLRAGGTSDVAAE